MDTDIDRDCGGWDLLSPMLCLRLARKQIFLSYISPPSKTFVFDDCNVLAPPLRETTRLRPIHYNAIVTCRCGCKNEHLCRRRKGGQEDELDFSSPYGRVLQASVSLEGRSRICECQASFFGCSSESLDSRIMQVLRLTSVLIHIEIEMFGFRGCGCLVCFAEVQRTSTRCISFGR